MQTLELPLFFSLESTKPLQKTRDPQASIENALNAIFPLQSEENKLTRMKRLLGETGKTLSDEQVECITSEFQFLIDTWMDEYEKDVFNGITLKEVLNAKNYGTD